MSHTNHFLAKQANKVGGVLSGLGITFLVLSILAAVGFFIAAGNVDSGYDYYSGTYSEDVVGLYVGLGIASLVYGAVLWSGFALGAVVARYVGSKHATATVVPTYYPAPTA